jgi:precorrin-2/cobalt-factor-2 C20-methyltransferase
MSDKPGVLYGLGVGPGDPDLITVKALEILRRVPNIFAASSTKNHYSLAQNIVRKHLPDACVERMAFPMTRDKEVLQGAWEKGARRVLEVLESGKDAAFVTLGDPLTYSTFCYLLRTVKSLAPQTKVVTVPGITSYHAAAAASNMPLTEGEESFHLISGAMGGSTLRNIIETSDNVVMLKTYRHFDNIYQTLEELDLLDRAVCISRCGLDGETVVENFRFLRGKKMPYLSLIIIKRKGLGI